MSNFSARLCSAPVTSKNVDKVACTLLAKYGPACLGLRGDMDIWPPELPFVSDQKRAMIGSKYPDQRSNVIKGGVRKLFYMVYKKESSKKKS